MYTLALILSPLIVGALAITHITTRKHLKAALLKEKLARSKFELLRHQMELDLG